MTRLIGSQKPSYNPQATIEGRCPEARMKLRIVASLIVLAGLPLALLAGQAAPANSLTDSQKLGQRLFYRQCAVCHAPPLINSKAYAPVLYKDVIEGQEEATRQITRKGLSGLMPGFEYGLKPAEVDAIIEYLKTVPKPSLSTQTGESDKRAD